MNKVASTDFSQTRVLYSRGLRNRVCRIEFAFKTHCFFPQVVVRSEDEEELPEIEMWS